MRDAQLWENTLCWKHLSTSTWFQSVTTVWKLRQGLRGKWQRTYETTKRRNSLSSNTSLHYIRSGGQTMRVMCRQNRTLNSVEVHLAKTIFQVTSCIPTLEGFDKPGREQRGKGHTHDPVREYRGQTISQLTSCITKSKMREKAGGADNDRAVYSILPNNKVRKPSSN